MPSKREWEKVSRLFDEALNQPTQVRFQWLRNLPDIDEATKEEVSQLLKSLENASQFLGTPAIVQAANLLGQELASGLVLGDFEILKCIGKGALATVYKARQVSLDREVAIKVANQSKEEARTLAILEHDNIVRVYFEHSLPEKSLQILCMQYVPGFNLAEVLEKIPLKTPISGRALTNLLDGQRTERKSDPVGTALRSVVDTYDPVETVLYLFQSLVSALAHAHAQGVLHLDIKPANILLNPFGRALLTDFNISFRDQMGPEKRILLLGGTDRYMSPEQRRAMETPTSENLTLIDFRSDLFSLGKVMREFLDKTELGNSPAVYLIDGLVDTLTQPDPGARKYDTEQLGSLLSHSLEIHQSWKRLPKLGNILERAQRLPTVALFLAILSPQIVAGVVNLVYNGSQIVGHLTPEQQEHFVFLAKIWNPIIYSIGIAVVLPKFLPIFKFLRTSEVSLTDQSLSQFRHKALRLPMFLFVVGTLSWGASFLFFPSLLSQMEGGLPAWAWQQFSISFGLSWLIAGAYSVFLTQFFMARFVYIRLLDGTESLSQVAPVELTPFQTQAKRFVSLSAAIPLVTALAILLVGPGTTDSSEFGHFRLLIGSLMGLGLFGFMANLSLYQTFAQTVAALKGR